MYTTCREYIRHRHISAGNVNQDIWCVLWKRIYRHFTCTRSGVVSRQPSQPHNSIIRGNLQRHLPLASHAPQWVAEIYNSVDHTISNLTDTFTHPGPEGGSAWACMWRPRSGEIRRFVARSCVFPRDRSCARPADGAKPSVAGSKSIPTPSNSSARKTGCIIF